MEVKKSIVWHKKELGELFEKYKEEYDKEIKAYNRKLIMSISERNTSQ